jgi:hypothetical protein
MTSLKLKLSQWKRRDTAKQTLAFIKQFLGGGYLPNFGMEGGEPSKCLEVGSPFEGGSAKRHRIVIAADCLKDRCPLDLWLYTGRAEALGGIKVGQRSLETMQAGTRPRPR